MANLSNINNKFLFTDGDFLLIGGATANSISATESGVAIKNSNAATLSLQNSATNGKNHTLWSNTDGSFNITDIGVATRFTIASGGDVYIPSGNVSIGNTSVYPSGSNTILQIYSVSVPRLKLQNSTTGTAATAGSSFYVTGDDLIINNGETGAIIQFEIGGQPKMRIDGDGNVGIGTTSLQSWARLQVAGTAGAQTGANQALYVTAPSTTAGEGVGIRLSAASGSNEAVGIIGMVNNASGNAGSMTFHTYNLGADIPERMRIDSSGNVGIGTDSPSATLNIKSLNSSNSDSLSDVITNSEFKLQYRADDLSSMYLGGLGSERGYLQSINGAENAGTSFSLNPYGGNVGIGTTSPNDALEVAGNSATTHRIRINNANASGSETLAFVQGTTFKSWVEYNNSNGNFDIWQYTNNDLRFGTNNTERMRIDSSGKVEVVNSSNPTFSIASTSGATSNYLNFEANSHTQPIQAQIQASDNGDFTADMIFNFKAAGTSGVLSEKMRITSGGDVLVQATSTGGNGLSIRRNATQGTVQQIFNRANTTLNSYIFDFQNNGTTVGYIRYNNTTTAYVTSSDYRLKENVVEMTGALDRVSQLKPSRFNFIADADKTVDGFLAHEVQEIVPEAISGEKDAVDEEGNPDYQGIDQSKLVPLLVGAIQELKAEIETLKTQINN